MDTTNELIFKDNNYRDYSNVSDAVKNHYLKMRTNQTYDYVQKMKKKYLQFDKPLHLWDALGKLDALIDVSDPDLDLPNVQHLIQSAEAIRADQRPDWMQLVGLIHDLGKVMYLWGSDEDGTSQAEQWGLVGDVFVVGCELPDTCVYPEFNELNQDMTHHVYGTKYGVYKPNCGLQNLELAWGHDEYLYQVLKNHKTNSLPEAGMAMIRFHSFYPWHTGQSYSHLLAEEDVQIKEWINDFNTYDLYTKCERVTSLDEIMDHYKPIAEKYLGTDPIYW